MRCRHAGGDQTIGRQSDSAVVEDGGDATDDARGHQVPDALELIELGLALGDLLGQEEVGAQKLFCTFGNPNLEFVMGAAQRILGFALGWSKIRVPGEQRIVLGIVFLVLLVLELTGTIDIFKKT